MICTNLITVRAVRSYLHMQLSVVNSFCNILVTIVFTV